MPTQYATLPVVNKEERIIIDAKYYPILIKAKWYLPSGMYNPSQRPFTFDPDTRPEPQRNKSGKRFVSLERALMKPTQRQFVKHLNGNLLDCRKVNMELVTTRDAAATRDVNPNFAMMKT